MLLVNAIKPEPAFLLWLVSAWLLSVGTADQHKPPCSWPVSHNHAAYCRLASKETIKKLGVRPPGSLPPAAGPDTGSDIHVMLTLRRSSREVVVADKQFDPTDMMGEFFGKRQRVADQPWHALAHRVVEPLDVIGLAG
jgi:hypothetical protein